MAYNTGNPLGSTDPRDLYDNAENLDNLVNGDQAAYNDRLGKSRRSWRGMEDEFAAFIASSGYQFAGDYASGIEITQYNQVVRDSSGEFWRVSGSTELPYTTTGAVLPEGGNFVAAGDAALRQDLASPDKGAAMVARGVVAVDSIADLLALPEGQRKESLRYLVKGYHAGSDIGGGEFYWDVSRVSESDGGLVLYGFIRAPTRYITPEMFGASSSIESSDALQAWVYADSVTPKILCGKYLINKPIDIPSGFHARSYSAELIVDFGPAASTYYSQFRGALQAVGENIGSPISISADTTEDSSILKLPVGHGLTKGDYILVDQDNISSPSSEEEYRRNWVSTVVRVEDSEVDEVSVNTQIPHKFLLSRNARVQKLAPVDNINIEGHLHVDLSAMADRTCTIYFERVVRSRLGRVSAVKGAGRGVSVNYCQGIEIDEIDRRDPVDVVEGGYVMSFLATNSSVLRKSFGLSCRHAFDASTGSFDLDIGDVIAINCKNAANGHGMNTTRVSIRSVRSYSCDIAVGLGNASFRSDRGWHVNEVYAFNSKIAAVSLDVLSSDLSVEALYSVGGAAGVVIGGGAKGLRIGYAKIKDGSSSSVNTGDGASDVWFGSLILEGGTGFAGLRLTGGFGENFRVDYIDTRLSEATRPILVLADTSGKVDRDIGLEINGGFISADSAQSASCLRVEGSDGSARTGIKVRNCVVNGTMLTYSRKNIVFTGNEIAPGSSYQAIDAAGGFIASLNMVYGTLQAPADNGVDIIVQGNAIIPQS